MRGSCIPEGIVNTRREGKSVIYHLAREEAALIVTVLRDAFCKRPHDARGRPD